MVLKKLKDYIDKNETKANEKRSRSLGFSTVKDYQEHKQKLKDEIRAKIKKEKIAKGRKKLEEKIIYNETTSPAKKVMDIYEKGFQIMDKVQDGIKQFDDAIDQIDDSIKGMGGVPNQNNKSKKGKSRKKKSKKKKSDEYTFPNSNFY